MPTQFTNRPDTIAEQTASDPRWQRVIHRDIQADGSFVFSVSTTGVYCRPSCASRRARPENVRFHGSPAEAERAGFRPCKRCLPDQSSADQHIHQKIVTACRSIESAEEEPSLHQLAAEADLSPAHFHRLFRKHTGTTPKRYALAQRSKSIATHLPTSPTVTDAIYNAGFNSSSRFYEKSNSILGMTPTSLRTGGKNTSIHFAIGECTLGSILVAQSERGICAILLGDDPERLLHDFQDRFPNAVLLGGDDAFDRTVAEVIAFVDSPGQSFALPLDIQGTAFQQRVWQALRELPLGSTVSYAGLATKIGSPQSVRAVANACAANNHAIAIPCHRVLRSNGDISGYRWGVERKQALLNRESHFKSSSGQHLPG